MHQVCDKRTHACRSLSCGKHACLPHQGMPVSCHPRSAYGRHCFPVWPVNARPCMIMSP